MVLSLGKQLVHVRYLGPSTPMTTVGTLRWECLDKFIVFGKRHLDYLISEFVQYYNHQRSHMEREHLAPVRKEPEEVDTLTMDQIEAKSYVGGLVKSFERKAA